MSMKNSSDKAGNRTRDLPACSAVPRPTAETEMTALISNYLKCTCNIFMNNGNNVCIPHRILFGCSTEE